MSRITGDADQGNALESDELPNVGESGGHGRYLLLHVARIKKRKADVRSDGGHKARSVDRRFGI
jgi:hypothetical protein